MRCVFRETPPPIIEPRLVDTSRLRQAILESFYSGISVEIAFYPSLEDAIEILSERLGGLYKASGLPRRLARLVTSSGRTPLISNPTPTGDRLTCRDVCVNDTVVVYEGGRVYYPTESLILCDCRVLSVGTLEEYGVDSSLAWVAGIEGGVRAPRLPGALELSHLVGLVRRIRSRGVAAAKPYNPVKIGPFAALYDTKPRIAGEVVDASYYDTRSYWAISLFMEPGCYLEV